MGKKNTNKAVEKQTKSTKNEEINNKIKEVPVRNDKKQKHKDNEVVVKATSENKSSNHKEQKHDKKNKTKKEQVKEEDAEIEDNESEFDNETVQNSIKQIFQEKLKLVEADATKLFNDSQIKQAVDCLKTLLNKHYEENLDIFSRKENEMIQVNFTFSNLPFKYSQRPVSIPVQLNNSSIRKVCLIIKDNFVKQWKQMNLEFDSDKFQVDVIPYSELKNEYATYENKRNLLKRFDMLLCDKGLYMILRKVLGRAFYNAKKYPMAVTITEPKPFDVNGAKHVETESNVDIKEQADKIKKEIVNAVSNVSFYMSNGPNYNVKAAYLAEEKTDNLVKKIKTVAKHTLSHILKWGIELQHLKCISLKFTNSIELPIFNQLSEEEINAYHSQLKENNKEKKEKDNKNDNVDKKDKKKKSHK